FIYIYGRRYLKHIGNKLTKEEQGDGATFGDLFKGLLKTRTPLIVTATLVLVSIVYMIAYNTIAYGLLYIFVSLVVGMMMMIYRDLGTKIMKNRFVVVIITFM